MRTHRCVITLASGLLLTLLLAVVPASAQIQSYTTISELEGGFSGVLHDGDAFGFFLAALGDVDGDGVMDIAAGAAYDDDGGPDRGAVWILFLNPDGTVRGEQKISQTQGGFFDKLDDGAEFGHHVCALGDVDGDGIPDLGVGASSQNDGGLERGAYWVLRLKSDGTVKNGRRISDTSGGFTGVIDDLDHFGHSSVSLGDLDGDGIRDIAIGALGDDDGGTNRGAVWVMFLKANATVRSYVKIADNQGGFTGLLKNGDEFGHDLDNIGDLDGDGVVDLLAGAPKDDDGGVDKGAAWVLFMNPNGTVKSYQKISEMSGDFSGGLKDGDLFGHPAVPAGDLDSDGVMDFAFGAPFDDGTGQQRGAFWELFMRPDGTVRHQVKINDLQGGSMPVLHDMDMFSHSIVGIGDLDGDGSLDFAASCHGSDSSGPDRGAVFVLFGEDTVFPDVLLSATPATAPIVIPPTGGSFDFTVKLESTLDRSQTIEYWGSITFNGVVVDVVGPFNLTFGPGELKTRSMTYFVDPALAPGRYHYVAQIGVFPEGAIARVPFSFVKN